MLDAQQLADGGHALLNVAVAHPPQPQPEGDVPGHAEVGEEGVVLVNEADAASLGRGLGDILAGQDNPPPERPM